MYTIREASARSGVGIPLLRAWERRYGVVSPTRTPSGYRLYDDVAIDRLRAMRHLIEGGWSARQASVRIRDTPDAELSTLIPGPAEPTVTVPKGAEPSSSERIAARLVDAAERIDASAMDEVLDEAFAGARFEAVAGQIVMPALRAIGDGWARGEINVAGEHAASHAVLRRLAMAYEAAGDTEAERPILVGLGPGSRHELGAFAFAIAARRAGLPVLYLGPDLPADDWTSAALARNARAAVVGVPTRADVGRARTVLHALRTAGSGALRAVGGEYAARAAADGDVLALPDRLSDAVATLRTALADADR